MWMIAANFRRTHSPSRLAWSEGWRPPGAQSTFIRWTGWTLAMTLGHDDSTINIVMAIIIIIIIIHPSVLWDDVDVCAVHWRKVFGSSTARKWFITEIKIGNESVPIQLALCWFAGLAISNPTLKYNYIFQIKYTEAILSDSSRKLLWFEISKMLIAVLKNKFVVLCYLL